MWLFVYLCTCLTGWWGQCYVQVPSPGVFNAGLHLHMLQWVDYVLLALTGFGWNLYSDFTCSLQVPVGCMKIAGNETHKQRSLQILQIPLDILIIAQSSGKQWHCCITCWNHCLALYDNSQSQFSEIFIMPTVCIVRFGCLRSFICKNS